MRAATLVLMCLFGCAPSAPREFDETIEGSLEDADARLDDGTPYDAFELRARKGQRLTAELSSEDFDPTLQLLGAGDARIADNDDARFGATRARLDETIPEDGAFKLLIRAHEGSARGAYRLEVKLIDP